MVVRMTETQTIVIPRRRSRISKRRRQTGALPLIGALPSLGSAASGLLTGTGVTALGSRLLSGLKGLGSKAGSAAGGSAGGATTRQALLSGAGGFGLSEWLRQQELGPIDGEHLPMLVLGGGGLLVGAVLLRGGLSLDTLTSPIGLAIGAGALVGGALLFS